MPDSVERWVITHISTKGVRVMTHARQGRNTHATWSEGLDSLAALLGPEARNDIPGVFGKQALGTFKVLPVRCYAGHFDPIRLDFAGIA